MRLFKRSTFLAAFLAVWLTVGTAVGPVSFVVTDTLRPTELRQNDSGLEELKDALRPSDRSRRTFMRNLGLAFLGFTVLNISGDDSLTRPATPVPTTIAVDPEPKDYSETQALMNQATRLIQKALKASSENDKEEFSKTEAELWRIFNQLEEEGIASKEFPSRYRAILVGLRIASTFSSTPNFEKARTAIAGHSLLGGKGPDWKILNQLEQIEVAKALSQYETTLDEKAWNRLNMGGAVVLRPFKSLDELFLVQQEVGENELGFSVIPGTKETGPLIILIKGKQRQTAAPFQLLHSAEGHTHHFAVPLEFNLRINAPDKWIGEARAKRKGGPTFILGFHPTGRVEAAIFSYEAWKSNRDEKVTGELLMEWEYEALDQKKVQAMLEKIGLLAKQPKADKSGLEEAQIRAETFVRALVPEAAQGLKPIVIGAGLEEQHPELRALGRLSGLPILFAGRLTPDQVAVELITRWDARDAVMAGLEQETDFYASALEGAGISVQRVTPATARQLILAILSKAAGLEEAALAAQDDVGRFLDDLAALGRGA